jgi:pilus assembly protein FimV
MPVAGTVPRPVVNACWGAIQMKRPLQLPLAIALALSGTDALALGLGTIHVNSKLNQPLDAEIPVLQGTAGEAEGLLVQLAAAEDFDRVGLNRARLAVPLEFSLVKGGHGDMVIKVTSKEVIKEPFLDFLVEANWPKGRLLREYTVLLDPPVMAPASGTTAVTTAAKAPERAATQVLPEPKPKPAPKAKAPPVAVAPRAEAPSKPAPVPAPAAPPPKRTTTGNAYTVDAGDTLSGIARDVRPDESTNINQLMLALLKQNPNAFYKDNINALKRGAILRIPSADQIKAAGSASEAAAQVHSQIEDWRGGAATKATLVADTGTKPEPKTPAPIAKTPAPKTTTSTAPATPKTGNERLELVPPKAGKDSVAMADRPGAGAGSAAASSELKSELARTKEALTSRDQEASELKSRVKELEDIKNKTDRQLSLKDSEIADLQNKLKDLREQESKTGAKTGSTATTTATPTTPAPASSATPSPTTTSATPAATSAASGAAKTDKVSKEDIWGTTSATPDTKTAGTSATSTTPAGSTPSNSASTTPATTPSSSSTGATPPAAGSTAATGTTTPPSTSTTPSAGTTSSSTAATSSSAPTPPSASTIPSSSTTTPDTSPSSTASTSTPAVTKPASTTSPVKPAANTRIEPLTTSGPAWYEAAWVKPAAIGAAALLLLAGLLGMRKRKAAVATGRGSIAGAFGDSPLREDNALGLSGDQSEEQALRDQLMDDPTNAGLHLELLSLLYAERDVGAFEDAAEVMHAHIVDPHQPEWLEVKAMGQELAPHNALFADGAPMHDAFDDEAVTAPHTMPAFDHDDVFTRREPAAPAPQANTAFDFDLDPDLPATGATAPLPSEPAFSFDNLPPIDFATEAHRETEADIAPPPLHVDEDEFPGEDGVGTKLDLAKAYLDMGDPEGARSMLEEVLAEGNDVQKGEARRLMSEIR